MKYRIEDIPFDGMTLKGEQSPEWLQQSFPDLDIASVSPIRYDIRLARTDANVSVKGSVQTVVRSTCSRCLEPFDLSINSDFSFSLTPSAAYRGPHEKELLPDELELDFYEGDAIDVGKIIVNQIILSLPIKPLCRENCQGLCPNCGINKNQETCTCSADQPVDPRMAALKKLKK